MLAHLLRHFIGDARMDQATHGEWIRDLTRESHQILASHRQRRAKSFSVRGRVLERTIGVETARQVACPLRSASAFRKSCYFLGGAMVSLAALATRNLTTVLALILMVSRVWGLRPMRAFLSAFTSRPSPGMTNTPFFFVSFTAVSASRSRNAADCLLVNSSFSAIVRTSAVLVMPVAIVCPSFLCVISWAHGHVLPRP